MKTVRRGPTLFEAMSRAPVGSGTQRRTLLSSIFPTRGGGFASRPAVAEPLTEQQAIDELAARQAEVERKQQEIEAKRVEKQARRAEQQARKVERQAQKAAAKAERADHKQAMPDEAPRLTLSLSTPALVGIAGFLSILVLAAYAIGRQSKDPLGKVSTVAAVVKPALEGGPVPSELVKPAPKIVIPKQSPPIATDLSELLKKPEPKAERMVSANKPANVASEESAGGAMPEDMNYLQIESFLITRDRNGEQLLADLTNVRKFLTDRGVRTFARKRNNGYVLFCEQGARPGRDHASERVALQKKFQQLGQEYRAAGGLYQFKGCLFVSYSSTRVGDPV